MTGHAETVRNFLITLQDNKDEEESLKKSSAKLWSPEQISLASNNLASSPSKLVEFCQNHDVTRRDQASELTRIKNIADHSVNLSTLMKHDSQVDNLRMTS